MQIAVDPTPLWGHLAIACAKPRNALIAQWAFCTRPVSAAKDVSQWLEEREGFDLPQLDTLFLTLPVSFKGRIIQYAGRLHRACEGKSDVRIYDYAEPEHPLTSHMHRKRMAAYRGMGYRIAETEGILP